MKITMELLREELDKIDWDIDVESLHESAPLVEQGLDSLDMISLLFRLEEAFLIKIPDRDLDSLRSLENFVQYLNRKI